MLSSCHVKYLTSHVYWITELGNGDVPFKNTCNAWWLNDYVQSYFLISNNHMSSEFSPPLSFPIAYCQIKINRSPFLILTFFNFLLILVRVSKGRVAFWLNSRLLSLGRNISNFVVLGSGLGKNLNFQLSIKFGWKVLAPYVVVYIVEENTRGSLVKQWRIIPAIENWQDTLVWLSVLLS